MPYEFGCPNCRRNISLKFLYVGETTQCPWCKHDAAVPVDAVDTESPSSSAAHREVPAAVGHAAATLNGTPAETRRSLMDDFLPWRERDISLLQGSGDTTIASPGVGSRRAIEADGSQGHGGSLPPCAQGDAPARENLNSVSKGLLWSLWNLIPLIGGLILLVKICNRTIVSAAKRWFLLLGIVGSGVLSYLNLGVLSVVGSVVFLGLGVLSTVLILTRIGWRFYLGLLPLLPLVSAALLIGAVLVPRYMDVTETAKIARCHANQKTLEGAILMYMATHDGETPRSLEELVPELIDAVPYCPEGGRYVYSRNDGSVTCTVDRHRRTW